VFVQITNDNPQIITVVPNGTSLSIPLQSAFQTAYDMWAADPFGRRPVIELPIGEFVIDEIPNNNRGNYPFRLPPTFKLTGQGKGQTIIKSAQAHGSQYRFLMTRPKCRIDVIADCPSLEGSCVQQSAIQNGALNNAEVSGITFINFDNAIGLTETQDFVISDCSFVGSLVAIQLVRGNQYGNKRAQFVNCDFDSQRTNGEKLRFALRFETPFYANWYKQVPNVASKQERENLGAGAVNYDTVTMERQVTDDQELVDYLDEFFGTNYDADITNSHCLISGCNFTNASYSAIEFAGTLNTFNTVQLSNFYNCDGTAIEFDKGASYNTAYQNTITGMKPTTVFSPSIPYVFQAAIQEQEGSDTADRQLKDVIEANNFADPNEPNFKGDDIFERAALLPVGNQIIENQFDVSSSYLLTEYESSSSKRATLPDVYPSIKLSKPNKTKVMGNQEFVGNTGKIVTDTSKVGQSILIYPDDTLRENRGDIKISDNKMHGGLFIISGNDQVNFNQGCLISDNEFGNLAYAHRAGLIINGCIANNLEFKNNKFYCSENGSSISIKKISIDTLTFDANEFYIKSGNSFYLSNLDAEPNSSRTLNFTNNLIDGGIAVTLYDWTSPSSSISDTLIFSNNELRELSGSAKVVGVILLFKNLTVSGNSFLDFEDKTFQFYGLSDSLNHSPKNTLTLGTGSQSRAYSRNYANTSGSYITDVFWQA
jgi:hypothetical protein